MLLLYSPPSAHTLLVSWPLVKVVIETPDTMKAAETNSAIITFRTLLSPYSVCEMFLNAARGAWPQELPLMNIGYYLTQGRCQHLHDSGIETERGRQRQALAQGVRCCSGTRPRGSARKYRQLHVILSATWPYWRPLSDPAQFFGQNALINIHFRSGVGLIPTSASPGPSRQVLVWQCSSMAGDKAACELLVHLAQRQ
jgi:hypothetical protein